MATKKYECNKCKDDPYDVEYVDVGVGSVPAAILWHCHECYEVIEKGRNRKTVRFESWLRYVKWLPKNICGCIYHYIKYNVLEHEIKEEADIPF